MSPLILLLLNFLFALVIGKPIAKILKNYSQVFRKTGEENIHQSKEGTGTMGGLIFLIPIFCSLIYLYFKENSLFERTISVNSAHMDLHPGTSMQIIVIALGFFIGALMGLSDDLIKIQKKHYGGIDSKTKLLIQFAVSTSLVYLSDYFYIGNSFLDSIIENPLEYAWAFLVIAGATNAINLTDGLDGLATGISVISFLGFGVLFVILGNNLLFSICISVAGALLGFLVFNKHPAQIFMGDTGSLALGMGLGVIAYSYNIEWFLIAFAFVPVIEAISVILQVLSAKLSRKFLGKDIRLFKMAPLHHHLELSGIEETKVVRLLWTVQFMAAVLALIIAKNLFS